MGQRSGLRIPSGARVVEATGKFLIPGLWDMHVHTAFGDWFPGARDIALPLFVANGVTGVRDMGGDLDVLLEWRKAIAEGSLVGPRMVICGPDARRPEAALSELRGRSPRPRTAVAPCATSPHAASTSSSSSP